MPDDPEQTNDPTQVEPRDKLGSSVGFESLVELKNRAVGLGMLVVVCSLLWVLFQYGPGLAERFGEKTQETLGVSLSEDDQAGIEAEARVPETEIQEVGPIRETLPNEVVAAVTSPPKSINAMAREQILKALGGSEKAVVEHVAVSGDESSMVAAVRWLDSEESLEIYFDRDDYGRYISTSDSSVDRVIKIWTQQ